MRLSTLSTSFAFVLAVLLVVLPWVNPFAIPPTSTVQPFLVCAASAALLLCLLVVSRMSRQSIWRVACWGWLVAATVNAVFGLAQYLDLVTPFKPWINQAAIGQAFGNLRQRNLFATLCSIGVSTLAWGMAGWQMKEVQPEIFRPARRSWVCLAATALLSALLGAGLAASGSRTGLLELALLWILVALWQRPLAPAGALVAPWQILAIGTGAYLVSSWLLPELAGVEGSAISRLLAGDPVCSSRRVLWSNAWQMVMQKPWLGWGWDQFGYAQFMVLFDGPRFCVVVDNAHNLPLHLAVTLGLPIAVLIVALTAWVLLRAQPWRASDAAQQLAWAVLALIGLHSLLEFPLWSGPFQFAAVVCVWYLYGSKVRERTKNAWLRAPFLKGRIIEWSAMLLTVIVLVACFLASKSYDRVSMLFVPPHMRPAVYAQGITLQRRDVMLFVHEVSFTRLGMELTRDNAQESLDIANSLLHFNVSYFVVERIIASLNLLGRQEEAHFYEVRYAAAFPVEYAKWVAAGRKSTFFPHKLGP